MSVQSITQKNFIHKLERIEEEDEGDTDSDQNSIDCRADSKVSLFKLNRRLLGRQKYGDYMNKPKEIYHPNILKHYDIREINNQLYLESEYIQYVTLYEFLRDKNQEIKLDRRLRMAINIVSAMHHIHAQNMLHLKLMSPLILVDTITTTLKLAYLSVFNSSLFQSFAEPLESFLYWASPEVAREQDLCEKSDVWSFGCILHELIYGKTPLVKYQHHEINGLLKYSEVEIPLEFTLRTRDGVPLQIKQLIMSCLKRDKQQRPTFENIGIQLKSLIASSGCEKNFNSNFEINESIDSVMNMKAALSPTVPIKSKNINNKPVVYISDSDYTSLESPTLSITKDSIDKPMADSIDRSMEESVDESSIKSNTSLKSLTFVGKLGDKTIYKGPRGGLYYINGQGNKSSLNALQRRKFNEQPS